MRRPLVLAGARTVERAGFRVLLGRSVFARHGHLAGPDAARAADLNRMLRDPGVRCVLLARGGYGAMRIAPEVDWDAMRRDPKIFAGFSDATFLHLGFAAKAGVRTLHGPNLQVMGRKFETGLRRWVEWVTMPHPPERTRTLGLPRRVAGPRRAVSGRVFGGNLMMLDYAVGTDVLPSLRGALLVLEEVGESPYRIDRMLTHLMLAGTLKGVRGIALGSFHGCRPRAGYPELPLATVLGERLGMLRVPVRGGLPVGHGARNLPFPLGSRATLDASRARLIFEEGLVS